MIEPIDRNEAIRRFDHIRELTVDQVVDMLKRVPTCRRKGKWILSDDRHWKTCSECGADVDVSMGLGIYVNNDEVSDMCFCPNCGSDNRERSEDE